MSSAKWRPFCLGLNVLTHCSLVMHIYPNELKPVPMMTYHQDPPEPTGTGIIANVERRSYFDLTKDTRYLVIMGELFVLYCDHFGEEHPCYKGTALYQ